MSQSTTSLTNLFSPHASLAAVAAQLSARGIFDLVRRSVHIAQKTVKDSPQDKLIDILLTLLSGAQSLVPHQHPLALRPGLAAQYWTRALQRTISSTANAGCRNHRKCGANARGAYYPLPRTQSGGFPQLSRWVVDLGCRSDWHALWEARREKYERLFFSGAVPPRAKD